MDLTSRFVLVDISKGSGANLDLVATLLVVLVGTTTSLLLLVVVSIGWTIQRLREGFVDTSVLLDLVVVSIGTGANRLLEGWAAAAHREVGWNADMLDRLRGRFLVVGN